MKNRIKAFKKASDNLKKTQEQVNVALTPILDCPLIDGVLLTELDLTAGISNEVGHGLQRKPRGWLVVRQRADSRIWDLQDTNAQQTRTLSIACSHDVTIDLWVF